MPLFKDLKVRFFFVLVKIEVCVFLFFETKNRSILFKGLFGGLVDLPDVVNSTFNWIFARRSVTLDVEISHFPLPLKFIFFFKHQI